MERLIYQDGKHSASFWREENRQSFYIVRNGLDEHAVLARVIGGEIHLEWLGGSYPVAVLERIIADAKRIL